MGPWALFWAGDFQIMAHFSGRHISEAGSGTQQTVIVCLNHLSTQHLTSPISQGNTKVKLSDYY